MYNSIQEAMSDGWKVVLDSLPSRKIFYTKDNKLWLTEEELLQGTKKVTIILTEGEYEVLQQLSKEQELSEEKILIQGLRLYQLKMQVRENKLRKIR